MKGFVVGSSALLATVSAAAAEETASPVAKVLE